MNENSNPEILITIIILSVLLAILSVTTAFCHTERSAGYKNKVNIGKKNYIIIYPIFFVLHMTAILLFNLPFPDLTCYLSFSIGSIAFIFLIQAVIAYFTMFKKFECNTGTKVGKSIVFSLISTPFYSILFGVAFAFFFPYSVGIPILMIIAYSFTALQVIGDIMKNGNTIFFILFTANFIVAILSACAYIFSWTLLIPFILLTIVVCGLNCAMIKSPKQNAICFIPTIVSAIATSIVGVTISFDLITLMFLSSQIAILLFMALISTIVKFKSTHNNFQLQKSTQIIITIVLFLLNICWGLCYLTDSARCLIPAVYFAGLGIMTLNCILLNRINFMLCSVMMCISSIVGSIFLNLRNISNFTFGVDNIFDVPNVLNILFNTLQYFTFYIIILIVLALYSYATHSKVKIEQSKYPNTKKR